MKVSYSGSESIAAPADAAFTFMTTPEKVANCLPDVVSTDIKDPTHFTSVVKVGVGPVRGNFTFDVTLQPDAANKKVSVLIHGGGLGSVVDQTAVANFKDNGDRTTTLDWTSDATISGPVASIGGRILDAQAKRIIEYVFSQVRQQLSGAAPATA